MSQINNGVHAILENPLVYESVQNIMGAKRGRERLVRDQIRPYAGMRILDLGCGPAEILTALPTDVEYVGYDMSLAYIAAARKKFGQRGTFHCRLLQETEVQTIGKFDLVMGLGVLHHLDDGSAEQFMRLARSALKPGGRMLTQDPCYAPGQNPIAKFLIDRDRGQNVRNAAQYHALASRVFENTRGAVSHRKWVPYTHWMMECTA